MGQVVCLQSNPEVILSPPLPPIHCSFAPWKAISSLGGQKESTATIVLLSLTLILSFLLFFICILAKANKLAATYISSVVFPMFITSLWKFILMYHKKTAVKIYAPGRTVSSFELLKTWVQTFDRMSSLHLSLATLTFLIMNIVVVKNKQRMGFYVLRLPFIITISISFILCAASEFDISPPLRGFSNTLVPLCLIASLFLVPMNIGLICSLRKMTAYSSSREPSKILPLLCITLAIIPSVAYLFVKELPNYVFMKQTTTLMLMCHSTLPDFLDNMQPVFFAISVIPILPSLGSRIFCCRRRIAEITPLPFAIPMSTPSVLVPSQSRPQSRPPTGSVRNEYDPNLVDYLTRPSAPPPPYFSAMMGLPPPTRDNSLGGLCLQNHPSLAALSVGGGLRSEIPFLVPRRSSYCPHTIDIQPSFDIHNLGTPQFHKI